MGLLKEIITVRKDLRLIISSATIDAQRFSSYYFDAPVFMIPGRSHVVQHYFSSAPEANYLSAAITTVFQIHISQPPGDILVFLTGEDEIEQAASSVEETIRKLGSTVPELIVCPIYANLPQEAQSLIFQPAPRGARKVILATNIAETSLTIDGVVYVVESGYSKINIYSPQTGVESLVVAPISRQNALQRAGRAGRNRDGCCFFLYTKWAMMNELLPQAIPEIQRTNLSSTVLLLKSLGVHDLINFEFLDPPPANTLIRCLEELYALGALASDGKLTRTGRQMAEMPINPFMAKSILAASQYGCVEEVLSIVAMLSESSALFLRPKDKKVYADSARARFSSREGGDMLTFLNIWNQWVDSDYSPIWAKENYVQQKVLVRARNVRDQLLKLCDRVEVEVSSAGTDHVKIRKAICSGYFLHAARLQRGGEHYNTIGGSSMSVWIHPSSSVMSGSITESRPKFLVYHELVLTSKEYMRSVMPIEDVWLHEVAPHYHKMENLDKLGLDKKLPRGKGKVGV